MALLLTFEIHIGILASIIIFCGQIIYIKDVFQKKIIPSVLSWFGWGLLMGTSMVAQILSEGWDWSQIGIIMSTIGCIAIGTSALILKNYSLEKLDWLLLLIGLLCVALYLLTNNPWLTTLYAITADLIIAFPTLIKTWKSSGSEKTYGWTFSFISWSLTMLISFNHTVLYALFPVYLFAYSFTMVYLVYWRKPRN